MSRPGSRYLTVDIHVPHLRRSMPNLKSPTKAEYACKTCRTRIATKEAVLSWEYRGSKGKAALFTSASNLSLSHPQILLMDSGVYRVQPSQCTSCTSTLGWKFVRASEKTEKWKEGYFVLELSLLMEERAPLSPLEEVQIEVGYGYGYGYRRFGEGRGLDSDAVSPGHRRTASDLVEGLRSGQGEGQRQRPLGPRQRRSGSGSGSASDC